MGRLTGIIGVVLVVALGILASASIFTVHQTQQAPVSYTHLTLPTTSTV